MELNHSKALKRFKKEMGQANHMLITILVGLDGIVKSDLELSPEFSTSWNPRSKIASVDRSKLYAKKSSLAWLVDNLDMYFSILMQPPELIDISSDYALESDYRESERSVYRRLKKISTRLGILAISQRRGKDIYTFNVTTSDIESNEAVLIGFSMTDLLICWRNRLTHFGGTNDILPCSRNYLKTQKNRFQSEYCGLDIEQTLSSFDMARVPSFKETASLIRATTRFVEELDKLLIHRSGKLNYADRIVVQRLKNLNVLNNLYQEKQDKIERQVRQILQEYGFSPNQSDGNMNEIDEYCKRVSLLTYHDAKRCIDTSGTFLI